MIYGLGLLEGGLTWDYAMMTMQNEMVKQLLQCVKGITVNDEEMALEIVKQVGPGGEFISHEHTYQNFRKLSAPKLIDRNNRESWKANGSKDIVQKSYETAREILETFKPEPLPEDIQKQLREIVKEAEAETEEIKAKEKEASRKAVRG